MMEQTVRSLSYRKNFMADKTHKNCLESAFYFSIQPTFHGGQTVELRNILVKMYEVKRLVRQFIILSYFGAPKVC